MSPLELTRIGDTRSREEDNDGGGNVIISFSRSSEAVLEAVLKPEEVCLDLAAGLSLSLVVFIRSSLVIVVCRVESEKKRDAIDKAYRSELNWTPKEDNKKQGFNSIFFDLTWILLLCFRCSFFRLLFS